VERQLTGLFPEDREGGQHIVAGREVIAALRCEKETEIFGVPINGAEAPEEDLRLSIFIDKYKLSNFLDIN
jgi:hypothetical protein